MKHPIRRRLIYLGFQGLSTLARCLPLALARAIGRTLGWIAYGLLRGQRRLVYAHLHRAFGETLTVSARTRIARGVFSNLGQNALEWFVLPRLSSSQIQTLVSSEGLEHLRSALSNGNGAIALTAHFGNWELIPIYLRSLGFEGGVLARRLRYPEYESFLISMRGARGIATLARGSLKDVARLLRANQIIGMLPDQDIESLEGVFVDFFGHPAYTPVGPAALSLMSGAPIVPCFILREGATFKLVIEPPLPVPETNDRPRALTLLTQAWSDVVESYIRRFPDHWVWMHRRWKTQPSSKGAEGSRLKAAGNSPQPPAPNLQPSRLDVLRLHTVLHFLLLSAYGLTLAISGCAKSHQSVAPPSTATSTPVASSTTPSPEATQQMSTFLLTGYATDGAKRWQLEGERASVEDPIVTIHHPNAVGYEPTRTAYLTASVAQVNQTNRHVRLEHDVTIHTSDGLWFAAPILHWIPDQNQVATDQPVRIETDHMLIQGREFSGLTQLKHATIQRDVELVLNPTDHDRLANGPRQVTITCDGPLSFDYGRNIATFEQNVHITDPNGELYSDKLVAYLDEKTHTIRYAEAIGKVRIHQNQNTALSERAVYEPAISKITLIGKPSLLVYPSQKSPDTGLAFGGLAVTQKESLTPSPKKQKWMGGQAEANPALDEEGEGKSP